MDKLRRTPAYRGATHTQSVLTITSNVVYGKKTGSTPDGRKAGEPFAPGANPMHGRDHKGALASMASVAKIDYANAQDGISYTFSIVPGALGTTEEDRATNLAGLLDAYFAANDNTGGGQHINVNVLNKETLLRRHGSPGELSATDDPGLGLRGQFHQADQESSRKTSSTGPSTSGPSARAEAAASIFAATKARCPGASRCRAAPRTAGGSARSPFAGYVHSVETAGAVDGPGIRYVVFLSGCPLTCAYCHNPDCMKMKRGGKLTDGAELIRDIVSYKKFMKATGGGVTLRGGEPLVQPDFTLGLFRRARRQACTPRSTPRGYLGANASDELLDATDLVLLDIKSGLPDVYERSPASPCSRPSISPSGFSAMGKPVWIRFVLVPGLTDGEDNLSAVRASLDRLDTVERLEILPFHKMGEHKWEALGMPYTLADTEPPTEDDIDRAKRILGAGGIRVLA